MGRQDVFVEFYYSGAWHQVTAYGRDPVTITRGKQDETNEPTPTTATFTLDNRDGRWSTTNPTSVLFGLVGLNTPVRVILGDWLFWGEVASMRPGRTPDFNPATGRGDAWVKVQAAGPLRRVNQGSDPLSSPLRRAITEKAPTAYWPLEDATDATSAASVVDGVAPMRANTYTRFTDATGKPVAPAGLPKWATGSGIPGSLPVPDFAQGGSLTVVPPQPGGTAGWRVGWVMVLPRDRTGPVTLAEWTTTTATWSRWRLQFDSGGLFLTAERPSDGVAGWSASGSYMMFDGQPHYVEVEAFDVAGNVDVRVYVDDFQQATLGALNAPNLAGTTGRVTTITLNPLDIQSGDATLDSFPQVGHLTLVQPVVGLADTTVAAMRGHAGESTMDRFGRLCAEQGITWYYSGPDPGDVQRVGVQRAVPFADLLAEIERTEAGMIYELRADAALVFTVGRSMHGSAVAATIDYAAGDLAELAYVLDDQGVRNDVTAKSSTTNATARRTLDTGRLSTAAPPAGIGRYKTEVDVNPADVGYLPSYARRALYAGTLPGLRFPRVTVDLVARPGLAASVSALDPGDRIRLINLPPDITPDTVDLVVLGTVDTIGTHTRRVDINAAPYARVDAPVVGGAARVDGGSSVLAAGVGSADTALLVTGGRWATSPADYPFDLAVGGGERVTAVGLSRYADDGFNRTVSGGWGTEPASGLAWALSGGASAQYSVSAGGGRIAVEVLNQTRRTRLPVALTDVEVLMLCASDVLAAGGNQECSPMLRIDPADVGGTYYYCEVEFSTTATVRARIVRRQGSVDTALSTAFDVPGLVHAANRTFWVRAHAIGSAIRMRVWQSGTPEPGAWTVEVTDTAITAPGQVGVRGTLDPTNTNTLPVNVAVWEFAITNPQKVTVTRAVNGVSRAWTAGTSVNVWDRPAVGL